MGWIRHHAIVVTGGEWGNTTISDAHEKARSVFPTVSGLLPSGVNGFKTFLIPPNGSKKGWPRSGAGDSRRDAYIEWLREQTYEDGSSPLDWVEVQYGGTGLGPGIVRYSCGALRGKGSG